MSTTPVRGMRIVELDSLRAIVALIVVFHHVFKLFRNEFEASLPAWIFSMADFVQAQNHRAVMAFFVLSGFTIALATKTRPPINSMMLRDYLYRRVTRIVPLYYFSLAWTAAFGLAYGAGHPDFSVRTLLGNVLFLQTSVSGKGNWFAPYGMNGPYWSLSYEIFYYLVLPVVLWLLSRIRFGGERCPTMLVSFGIVAMFCGLAANLLVPSPFGAFTTLWIIWLLGYVAFGLRPGVKAFFLVSFPAAVTIATEAAFAARGLSSDTLSSVRDGSLIGWLFGVAAIWRGWLNIPLVLPLRRGLNTMFERIGRGSYALYLLHYPILLAFIALVEIGNLSALGWITAGGFFACFIVFFCPWIEGVSLVIFRRRRSTAAHPSA
ncbi:acyltransferase family protein [Porphyrobacter sp. SLTP]|uniref:acyltransferase family protein n=1 Tax=Porphyrobacter sp. SLTP TaxID=2683266 RepID=UPI001413637E|nr:acyltransferase [Porphyrobacter sp. SLTP]NBB23590.1 acyltransferase family protein [Porphyrobacter sp. SLTP]